MVYTFVPAEGTSCRSSHAWAACDRLPPKSSESGIHKFTHLSIHATDFKHLPHAEPLALGTYVLPAGSVSGVQADRERGRDLVR